MGIYWVDMNWVLAIYSVKCPKKVPNTFEALVGYIGILMGILSPKIYTIVPSKGPYV